MSDNYTGWDGNTYPWPPPDGWYLASDNRWWAPGTGPNPPPTSVSQQTTAAHAPQHTSGTAAQTTQLPVLGGAQTGPPIEVHQQGRSADQYHDPNSPLGILNDPYAQSVDQAPPDWSQPRSSGRGIGRILLILVGIAVVVAAAGAGYIFFGDQLIGSDSDDTDAVADETAADTAASETTATTAAGAAASETAPTSEAPTDSSSVDSTTTDATGESTTSQQSTESTTADSATDTSADTTIDPAKVQRFREILTENRLTSDNINDEAINDLGVRLCIFAMASSDPSEYETFRQQAIDNTDSPLTPEALALVADAAVQAFCPEEAERLGVSV